VVLAAGLSKRFKIYPNALARLADWLAIPRSRPRCEEFWAVRDVSFELQRGECLGIIGPNGAGKTTLLKLLTGVLSPTSGRLELQGRVLSLLELGSDFSPELSGRQNARESMRLLGVRSGEAEERLHDIEAFADLGDHFNRPVKMYSSGMFVRLAFSIFSTMEPEVFLVDEALTVGDLRFAAKALARIRQMRERGTTLLFVSHNVEVVNQLCSRVLWIQAGRVQLDGAPLDVTTAYVQFMIHGGIQPLLVGPTEQPPVSSAALVDASRPTQQQAQRDIWLGQGWYPLEAYAGQIFRWAKNVADLVAEPCPYARELVLELEPCTVGDDGMLLSVDVGAGAPLQFVLRGREQIRIMVPSSSERPCWVRLITPSAMRLAPGDERSLAFRAFRWGWSTASELDSIELLDMWRGDAVDADLQSELRSMQIALQRHQPTSGARARVVRVVTCNADGDPSARFAAYGELTLEVTVEALADVEQLLVGVEINDMFGRQLYWTRSDLQSDTLPKLSAGELVTVRFHCARLLLGFGYYYLDVAVCGVDLENDLWQLIDRAWSFQVLNAPEAPVFGTVDLSLTYCGASTSSQQLNVLG
jgi:ABC-type polysaccharide/polyol phosphate transport system ATPase subunit